ncbi:MAG TPA: regulatory iron-sulfur-containing complex subunit RicT [Candidatus Hydrogenedentes bacterium]|jgi:cell fate regulator YaaT (PSP1 superfamily)|nr:regulatory iron-sulfur-containing complex subunit RicT [Candidatus Hydrogenedentota bacterium]
MQTVKIRLRKPTRVFTFLSEDIPLKRNDKCIVRSDRGLEYGMCIVAPEDCPEGMKELVKMNVVRRATLADETTFNQLQRDEIRAREVCAQKISQHKLPMKLVDVEYSFDKHRVLFYFTAAERVDFRKLVRDLAQELKTRIELRHIQVRDEAKLVGGLGVCGRELCCASWLTDFKPISMKMAKRQNLSLNPSKISGQCGRLLCCLAYENDMYLDPRKLKAAAQAALPQETESDPGLDEEFADEPDEEIIEAEPFEEADMDVLDDEPAEAPGEMPVPEPAISPVPQESAQSGDAPASKRRPRRRRRKKTKHSGGASGNSGGAQG